METLTNCLGVINDEFGLAVSPSLQNKLIPVVKFSISFYPSIHESLVSPLIKQAFHLGKCT